MVAMLYKWLLDDTLFPEKDVLESEDTEDEDVVVEEDVEELQDLYTEVRKYACSIGNLQRLKELTDKLPPAGPTGDSPSSLEGE
jgi:hypothetical protein